MATTRQTAAETYSERQRQCKALLAMLRQELADHARLAGRRPRLWTFAGDLGKVRQDLIEAVAFLAERDEAEIREEIGADNDR